MRRKENFVSGRIKHVLEVRDWECFRFIADRAEIAGRAEVRGVTCQFFISLFASHNHT